MFRRNSAIIFAALAVLHPFSAPAATRPNIILITLDSTRADRMGFLGSKAKLTPDLDGIAGQSLIFEQAYSQAPLTVVSHATILSGTYPQTHRANEFGAPLAPALPFVPDLLRARGYRTAAFVGSIALDPKNGFAPGFDRGFALYDAGFHPPERGQNRFISVERPAAQVAARATNWLAHNSPGPFFLWIQLNDPEAASGNAYNAAIVAADAAVGKLVAALRTAKWYEDSVIVIAADHGQSLGAHGEDSHGIFLYEETAHVPLLVKLPQDQSAGKRVRARASLIDIAPTLLELAGVAVPSQMQGQSLLRIANANPNADQRAYSTSDFPMRAFGWSGLESWRAGKYLYIKAPRPELYDLSSDPAIAHNLAQSSKAILETTAAQLDAFDRHFSGSSNASADLTSSEMHKLASLGYVGLQKSAAPAAVAYGGVDPKDGIAIANTVLSAQRSLDDGKPEKAVALLQPVMAGASKMYLAQYLLGVALAQLGQYPQAIERLRSAIELMPDSSWAHYEMGSSLLKVADYKTAAIHLEIACSRLPDFAEAHSLLAQAYNHLGKLDEARREQTRAAALKN